MRNLCAVVALTIALLPRVAAAQAPVDRPPARTDDATARRLTLRLAAGSDLGAGGNAETVSVGVVLTSRLELLVSGERTFVPMRVQYYGQGMGATRGGTLTFGSAELRVELLPHARVAPYVLAGVGRGVSRPNVNEIFPDGRTNTAQLIFSGGGARVPVHGRLSVFADARFLLDGEAGEVCLFTPVRAGIAWRF